MSLSPNLVPQDIYSLKAPMPSWRWKGRVVSNATVAAQSVNWDALIIEGIGLPNGASIPAKPVFSGGTNHYIPDFNDVQALQVSFYETEHGDANLALQAWRNLILNRVSTGVSYYGLPSEYQQKLNIDLFGFDSSSVPVMSYTVGAVWPTEPGMWNLAYTSSDRLILQCTLQCDTIIFANRASGPANLASTASKAVNAISSLLPASVQTAAKVVGSIVGRL